MITRVSVVPGLLLDRLSRRQLLADAVILQASRVRPKGLAVRPALDVVAPAGMLQCLRRQCQVELLWLSRDCCRALHAASSRSTWTGTSCYYFDIRRSVSSEAPSSDADSTNMQLLHFGGKDTLSRARLGPLRIGRRSSHGIRQRTVEHIPKLFAASFSRFPKCACTLRTRFIVRAP